MTAIQSLTRDHHIAATSDENVHQHARRPRSPRRRMVLAGAAAIVAGVALAIGLVATSSSGGTPATPAPAVSTSGRPAARARTRPSRAARTCPAPTRLSRAGPASPVLTRPCPAAPAPRR